MTDDLLAICARVNRRLPCGLTHHFHPKIARRTRHADVPSAAVVFRATPLAYGLFRAALVSVWVCPGGRWDDRRGEATFL